MAKLVDFGLHKVIDDHIKKVVKRVISEANLGTRLGRLRAQHEDPSLEFDLDDELEAALAEQHAMVVASSVKPTLAQPGSSSNGGVAAAAPDAGSNGGGGGGSAGGAASPSPTPSPAGSLGASAGASAGAAHRQPARGVSRLSVESSGLSMTATPEDADEEEQAIREAQEQQALDCNAAAKASPAKSPLGAQQPDAQVRAPALTRVRTWAGTGRARAAGGTPTSPRAV